MEKEMAIHSSTLAWKIPWTEEPGRLQSMGLLRVGRDWVTSLSLFTFKHWRSKWQPTPVFLPGESQGRGSLVGCRLWGRRLGHDCSDSAAAAAAVQSLAMSGCVGCLRFICSLTSEDRVWLRSVLSVWQAVLRENDSRKVAVDFCLYHLHLIFTDIWPLDPEVCWPAFLYPFSKDYHSLGSFLWFTLHTSWAFLSVPVAQIIIYICWQHLRFLSLVPGWNSLLCC